ncbi:MAG: glgA [Paenibacillaceae bacterium]|jgi:starch synthase|nr:glgA [Paenibacillaceae bacterium]
MRILFAASEAVPFIKSGGLADVIGSLPEALQGQGLNVRVILPKYGDIPWHFKEKLKTCKTFSVYLGWRNQYCGIQEMELNGIHYYFVDNEFYFGRKGMYGYGDDAERFIYFSRAVLEALPHLNFKPDIIHCHDWQTGLVPYLLRRVYMAHPFYQSIRTVFTIHNLRYQGRFNRMLMQDLLDIGDEAFSVGGGLEYHGDGNCMKAALTYADLITTVSKTYAEEIQTEYYGEGLEGVLRQRSARGELAGIVNGLDNALFDPMKDANLAEPFRNSLPKKRKNKTALQAELGLKVDESIPMIGIVSRLVDQKGFDLIQAVIDDILAENLQIVVLGTGDGKFEHLFRNKAYWHPDKLSAHITFHDGLARKIYAASDMFLMPSQFEPCGLGQLIAFRYRSVPIVRETGGLKDTVMAFDESTGEGTGFTFYAYNAHEMLYAIKRALECYRTEEQWSTLVKNISKYDFSWEQSAKQYVGLYEQIFTH